MCKYFNQVDPIFHAKISLAAKKLATYQQLY